MEDKELLLQDLCARLPYGVKISYRANELITGDLVGINGEKVTMFSSGVAMFDIQDIKPYLRPMTSMTEEELDEYRSYCRYYNIKGAVIYEDTYKSFDWLNKKMFDYRGLIHLSLAIEVTEENNPYKR